MIGVVFLELTPVLKEMVSVWTCSNHWIKTTAFYMVWGSKLKLGRYQRCKMYARLHHHGVMLTRLRLL